MADLPTMHPRKGTRSRYSTRIKQFILGGRRFNTDTLIDTFPDYLDDSMEIGIVNRENVLSSSYQVDNTYFVKVITNRHLKGHRFLTWWRNVVFRMSRLSTPFASFETPLEMAEYEFDAAHTTYEAGGAIPFPHECRELDGDTSTTAILYEYVPNAGKLDEDKKSLKAFEHIVRTMREMHNAGYTHTSLPYHTVESLPDGEPYITDPIGKTKQTDKALLTGIGFDTATLLARYTPHIGTLPALKILGEYYDDVELTAAYKAAIPIQVTVPNTPPWVINHVRTSINEYADADAVSTYLEIVGDHDAQQPTQHLNDGNPDTSPYSTAEFLDAIQHSDGNTETQEEPVRENEKQDDEDIRINDFNSHLPTGDPDLETYTQNDVDTRKSKELEDLETKGEEVQTTTENAGNEDTDTTETIAPPTREEEIQWDNQATQQTSTETESENTSQSIRATLRSMFSFASEAESTDEETTPSTEENGLPPE